MLPSKMKVNSKLLPIKGHYFLFNAGTAPLVPYLSTYARQLGFSSATVGLIYTVLPIFGLIAKPLFGIIADRFKVQKSLFIFFQIVTIVSFSAIYFIPGTNTNVNVELDCEKSVTVLRGCYADIDQVDSCKVDRIGNESGVAACDMVCDMTSPKMWQTVCEHWHIPQYCYSNTDSIRYTSSVANITVTNDSCTYVASSNVTLDTYNYVPHCRIGNGFVDVNQPCSLNCTNEKLSSAIGTEKLNMTCVNNMLNFRSCPSNISVWKQLTNEPQVTECETYCELDKQTPWRLMEICEGWGADVTQTCHPRRNDNDSFPSTLSFTGIVRLSTFISEHACVYVQLNHLVLEDGSIHYPTCLSQAQYQIGKDEFHSSCRINCNHTLLNEIFQETSETKSDSNSQYTRQFWLFFLMMIISWIGQAVVVTFADAICFGLLGTNIAQYGKQRLWGSVGWGIFSLTAGALVDLLSDGTYKDYTIAFILMFVFMTGDVIVSCLIKIESTKMSMNILADVGSLFTSLPTFIFIAWTIAVGLCTGLLWQFLFWLLEDISGLSCDGSDYTKTLQGLVSAIQTFCGEIPFMFMSGYILRKVGHANMMSLVLFAFGVRFILYSLLTNPWWVLPIEMFQGITFGMFYPTMASYANIVSPPGTETTVQGLVGAVFEGVGTSLGSFIGGRLYETYGGWNTFRWFGYGSLICCLLHVSVQYLFRDRLGHEGLNKGYSSAIRYEQPNDIVRILDEFTDDN